MSNLKLIENDAFYNTKFDDDIFLYWMLKWLNVDTVGSTNKIALKNMAKKFIEEILGEKLGYVTLTLDGKQPNFKTRQGIMMLPKKKLSEIQSYIYRRGEK